MHGQQNGAGLVATDMNKHHKRDKAHHTMPALGEIMLERKKADRHSLKL
jgi:hypothetical protein